MYLFTVEDRFMITGRGLTLTPGIGKTKVSPGARIKLIRPDKSIIHSVIRGIGFNEIRDIIVDRTLTKDDVPIGTEVWLDEQALDNIEPVKIRQNKKTLIPMITILILALLGMNYYIFLSGWVENNNTTKLIYILLTAWFIYTMYTPLKKLIKNKPILIFNNTELEIHEKRKPIFILWLHIKNWRIEKEEDGNTHYLTIETESKTHKINISWLNKRPDEIEALIQVFKNN